MIFFPFQSSQQGGQSHGPEGSRWSVTYNSGRHGRSVAENSQPGLDGPKDQASTGNNEGRDGSRRYPRPYYYGGRVGRSVAENSQPELDGPKGPGGPGGQSGPESGPIGTHSPEGSRWSVTFNGGRHGRSAPENLQSSLVQSVKEDTTASKEQSTSQMEGEKNESQGKKIHFSLFHIGK